MLVDAQVATFLNILAHHHVKYQIIELQFRHLGETIIRHFDEVLHVVIRLQGELLKKLMLVPENSFYGRRKWFKASSNVIFLFNL